MIEQWLKVVYKVFKKLLKVFEKCMKSVWKVHEKCLKSAWKVFEKCLKRHVICSKSCCLIYLTNYHYVEKNKKNKKYMSPPKLF